MKEIILQKSDFRYRENIYICRPLRRLRRLAVEYVKKQNKTKTNYGSVVLSTDICELLHICGFQKGVNVTKK